MTQPYKEKLAALRALMVENAIDAYMIPRGDEYLGEFVAPYAERLKYLTGFTGSAGLVVITATDATVMSDGRYTLQLEQQLDANHFAPSDMVKYPLRGWLYDHMEEGQSVGFDPKLHSISEINKIQKRLEAKNVALKPIVQNLIDQIWEGQPARPSNPSIPFPEALSGLKSSQKIAAICTALKEKGADGAILALPDSICWLMNIRGTDVSCTPIVQTYAYVDVANKTVDLFKDNAEQFIKPETVIALDALQTPHYFKQICESAGATVKDTKDPCIALKALKTPEEKAAIKQTHIHDGVALVKFLRWLENAPKDGSITEITIDEKLEEFRGENPSYKGPSFPTIAGFGPNGAVIHYRATPETSQPITADNIVLIDSGGQYLSDDYAGTTDITRTVSTGAVSHEIKKQFTLVLKGHIALAMAKFPAGTTGMQIDTAARQPLWNAGLDYAHGTGHGVGCYLDVHEEAASISPRGKTALEEGMLISNEPGYYEEGSHGIRIESLVFVQGAGVGSDMLSFETITLAPMDKNLILPELLSDEERTWLNNYHQHVDKMLSPLLSVEDSIWLTLATEAM